MSSSRNDQAPSNFPQPSLHIMQEENSVESSMSRTSIDDSESDTSREASIESESYETFPEILQKDYQLSLVRLKTNLDNERKPEISLEFIFLANTLHTQSAKYFADSNFTEKNKLCNFIEKVNSYLENPNNTENKTALCNACEELNNDTFNRSTGYEKSKVILAGIALAMVGALLIGACIAIAVLSHGFATPLVFFGIIKMSISAMTSGCAAAGLFGMVTLPFGLCTIKEGFFSYKQKPTIMEIAGNIKATITPQTAVEIERPSTP